MIWMSTKVIPKKNYLILIGTILLIISACFATFNIYNIYQETKIKKSVLDKKSIKFEDLVEITNDLYANTFLIIGYSQNSKIYQNEKEIKSLLKKNNLLDNVLYLDVTDIKESETLISDINEKLKLEEGNRISSVPAVIYYNENKVTYVKDGTVTKDDIAQIIDMYNLAS
jgi:hypothetical protein